MSIGASYNIDTEGGVSMALILAVLIGLHNIPEGMAVSVPLVAGGMKRIKAALLTAASGAPVVLGAWLGYWIGDIGAIGLAARSVLLLARCSMWSSERSFLRLC
mgnify:FL=1